MGEGVQVGAVDHQALGDDLGEAGVLHRPGRPAVQGDEDAQVGAGVEALGVDGVDDDGVHGDVGNARDPGPVRVGPGRAGVQGLVDVDASEGRIGRVGHVRVRGVEGEGRHVAGPRRHREPGRGGGGGEAEGRPVDDARLGAGEDDVGVARGHGDGADARGHGRVPGRAPGVALIVRTPQPAAAGPEALSVAGVHDQGGHEEEAGVGDAEVPEPGRGGGIVREGHATVGRLAERGTVVRGHDHAGVRGIHGDAAAFAAGVEPAPRVRPSGVRALDDAVALGPAQIGLVVGEDRARVELGDAVAVVEGSEHRVGADAPRRAGLERAHRAAARLREDAAVVPHDHVPGRGVEEDRVLVLVEELGLTDLDSRRHRRERDSPVRRTEQVDASRPHHVGRGRVGGDDVVVGALGDAHGIANLLLRVFQEEAILEVGALRTGTLRPRCSRRRRISRRRGGRPSSCSRPSHRRRRRARGG